MRKGFYFPIIFKLVILISFILFGVTFYISYKNAELFENVSTDREESVNVKLAESGADEVETLIHSYIEKIKFYSIEMAKSSNDVTSNDIYFNSDSEFLGLNIVKKEESESLYNERKFFVNNHLAPKGINLSSYLENYLKDLSPKNSLIFQGKIQVLNLSREHGVPMIGIGMPFLKNENGEISSIVWGFVRLDRIQKSFSNPGERSVYVVDVDGKILAHPNEKNVLSAKNIARFPIVKDALASTIRVKQKYFDLGESEGRVLGAFAKTSTDLIVISETPTSLIIAPSLLVRNNSYYFLGIALSISMFVIFLFSLSLTTPIENLLGLTKEIAHGNFDIEAKKIVTSNDEVGLLATAFDEMTIGLKERDKIKNIFNKFHGSTVTEELLTQEISLGGTKKDVTVFFSDIRGFTDFSEGHTPEEVVSMLNEYFEVMVAIISKNGGIVDKFIGDAIMAVWGVPNKSENDTKNAVRACLQMRIALNELNQTRIEKGLTPINIGMGLHAGEVISGQIGSSERMEFTIIGDTVNTASRIEGATKSFGSDLLLSKEVVEKIGDEFILEKAGESKVQGKTESLVLYRVNGIIEDGIEKIIKTPYSSYKAVEDKKSKVA
jgi:adenylate cyclase